MQFLCSWSLVTWVMALVFPSIFNMLPKVVNIAGGVYANALFSMINLNEATYDVIRNQGIFREPGVFVGFGNSLVTTREEGRADVTFVHDDFSLSLPTAIEYPQTPSVTETIIFLNSLAAKRNQE
jgi:hypothetical protein